MKITAMLAWWDEPEDELDACVRSMAGLCDKVVAVDGGYDMTPGATAASPTGQSVAIAQAASASGLEYDVFVPDAVWTGQVEKRDYMLRLAAPDADWLIAVDADHRLDGDFVEVRRELSCVQEDFIMHQLYTPIPDGVDVAAISPHAWHTEHAGDTILHSLIMRSMDDMHVEEKHWGYSGVRDGERRALCQWIGRSTCVEGKRHYLKADFRVVHVCFSRDRLRLDRNKAYCAERDNFVTANGYEP